MTHIWSCKLLVVQKLKTSHVFLIMRSFASNNMSGPLQLSAAWCAKTNTGQITCPECCSMPCGSFFPTPAHQPSSSAVTLASCGVPCEIQDSATHIQGLYMGKLLPTSERCYTWPNPSECCDLSVPLLWKGLVQEVWSLVIGLLVQPHQPSGMDYLLTKDVLKH